MSSSDDVLGGLVPYFSEQISIDDIEKIDALHRIFQNDFFDNTVIVDGKELKIKPYKYSNNKKDSLPDEFSRYYEKFVHLITRTVKATNWKTASNIREFRSERANRIHWIRPILDNCGDKRITRFRYVEDNVTEREYFWLRSKQYIVILEEIEPDYTLITGFCVDSDNQPYYQKKYVNRKK